MPRQPLRFTHRYGRLTVPTDGRYVFGGNYDESQHPRGAHGRWTATGAGPAGHEGESGGSGGGIHSPHGLGLEGLHGRGASSGGGGKAAKTETAPRGTKALEAQRAWHERRLASNQANAANFHAQGDHETAARFEAGVHEHAAKIAELTSRIARGTSGTAEKAPTARRAAMRANIASTAHDMVPTSGAKRGPSERIQARDEALKHEARVASLQREITGSHVRERQWIEMGNHGMAAKEPAFRARVQAEIADHAAQAAVARARFEQLSQSGSRGASKAARGAAADAVASTAGEGRVVRATSGKAEGGKGGEVAQLHAKAAEWQAAHPEAPRESAPAKGGPKPITEWNATTFAQADAINARLGFGRGAGLVGSGALGPEIIHYGEHQLGAHLTGIGNDRGGKQALQSIAHQLKLDSTGTKAQLISRITAHATNGRYSANFGGGKSSAKATSPAEATFHAGYKARMDALRSEYQQQAATHGYTPRKLSELRFHGTYGRLLLREGRPA